MCTNLYDCQRFEKKAKMSNVDLMDVLKANFLLMKMLCLFPFRYTKQEKLISSRFLLYFFICVHIATCVSLGYITKVMNKHPDTISNYGVYKPGVSVYLSVLVLVVVVTVVNNRNHRVNSLKLWNSLLETNRRFLRYNIRIDYEKLRKDYLLTIIPELLLTLVYSGLFTQTKFYYRKKLNPYQYQISVVQFFYLSLISMTTTIKFFSIFPIITEMFTCLQLYLQERSFSNRRKLRNVVRRISKLHENLSSMVRLANKILSVELVGIFTMYFIMFTINTYYVILCIVKQNVDLYVAISSFWLIFCAIKFICFAHVASKCMKKVRNT